MRKLTTLGLVAGLLLILSSSSDGAGMALSLQAEQTGTKHPQQHMIGVIKDERVVDNCGCSFGYPSEDGRSFTGYIFTTSYDVKTGWMNIDGQDVRLRLTHTTTLKVEKIGSRFGSTYVAAGIKVQIVYTIIRMCIPYSPDCETTGYNAALTVMKGERMQRIKLEGACGCY